MAAGSDGRRKNSHGIPSITGRDIVLYLHGDEFCYGFAGRKVASRRSLGALKKPSGRVRGV